MAARVRRSRLRVFTLAERPEDYGTCLHAMNLFYNFGLPLEHREITTRLLAVRGCDSAWTDGG